MNIRIMLVSDYEAVYDLWMSCAGMGLNDLDDSKEGISKFLQRNPETCFVAEINNRIVGSILARIYIPYSRPSGISKTTYRFSTDYNGDQCPKASWHT